MNEATDIFANIDPNLLKKFKRFHQANPHVYREFKSKARQIKNTGRSKYSGWVIVNAIRWEYDVRTRGEVFRINNDFIALYVRLLIYHQPEFRDFFEMRSMKPMNRKESSDECYRKKI